MVKRSLRDVELAVTRSNVQLLVVSCVEVGLLIELGWGPSTALCDIGLHLVGVNSLVSVEVEMVDDLLVDYVVGWGDVRGCELELDDDLSINGLGALTASDEEISAEVLDELVAVCGFSILIVTTQIDMIAQENR